MLTLALQERIKQEHVADMEELKMMNIHAREKELQQLVEQHEEKLSSLRAQLEGEGKAAMEAQVREPFVVQLHTERELSRALVRQRSGGVQ